MEGAVLQCMHTRLPSCYRIHVHAVGFPTSRVEKLSRNDGWTIDCIHSPKCMVQVLISFHLWSAAGPTCGRKATRLMHITIEINWPWLSRVRQEVVRKELKKGEKVKLKARVIQLSSLKKQKAQPVGEQV